MKIETQTGKGGGFVIAWLLNDYGVIEQRIQGATTAEAITKLLRTKAYKRLVQGAS